MRGMEKQRALAPRSAIVAAVVWLLSVVPGMAGVQAVAGTDDGTGLSMYVILDDNGDVWSFKGEPDEQPVKLQGLHDIVAIAPLIALRRDGAVFTWKRRYREHARDGESLLYFTKPRQVKGVEKAVSIYSGCVDSFWALLADGRIIEWSDMEPGGYSPRIIQNVKDVVQMAGCAQSGVVLTRDGAVRAFGENIYGYIDGHPGRPVSPADARVIFANGRVKKMEMTPQLAVILLNDGRVMYWGGIRGILGGRRRAGFLVASMKTRTSTIYL